MNNTPLFPFLLALLLRVGRRLNVKKAAVAAAALGKY